MYISLNPTIVTGRAVWPDFVRLAARTGFGGADVDLVKASQAGVVETKAIFEHLKIRPAAAGLPGEGVINLHGFFSALKQCGYDGGVSAEVFGRGLKEMTPEAAARLALESTREVMRRSEVL
jgi:hypothetical protein